MEYSNSSIRRQNCLLDQTNAIHLLNHGEYGVLSIQNLEGGAYGVPLNYVWDGDSSIFIHCAPVGRKLAAIKACPEVSFCIVGVVQIIPEEFTTNYESIILQCKAVLQLSLEEKMKAMGLMVGKYSPEYKDTGVAYAEKVLSRMEVIRLDIKHWSGKCKK